MSDSKAVKNAGIAVKHEGQFKKGIDPRRHMNGSKSRTVVEFNKTLRELLVAEGEKEKRVVVDNEDIRIKNVERLVKSVWTKAIEGESWAVNFIADRVEGKITQPIGLEGQIGAVILSDKFLPDCGPVAITEIDGTKPE